MCDVNKITKLKSAIIYKVVKRSKRLGKIVYKGPYSEFPIEKGIVDINKAKRFTKKKFNNSNFHNVNIIGRVTGFKSLAAANMLINSKVRSSVYDFAIIKLAIEPSEGMPIMRGTGSRIDSSIPLEHEEVLAGSKIKSITEVTV